MTFRSSMSTPLRPELRAAQETGGVEDLALPERADIARAVDFE